VSAEDSKRVSSWSGSDLETWEAACANSLSLARWEDLEFQHPEQDEELHTLTESTGGTQAVITTVEEAKSVHVELYDSSAMRRLSPYCKDFTTY
jgi:hypothetical protein